MIAPSVLGWRERQAEDPAAPGGVLLMPTRTECPAPAPAAVIDTSPKLVRLLRKRLRQLARVALVLAIGLALAAAAFATWWMTSLNGLPDIGEPFDVEAFRAFRLPDERNAFAYLRRANEKCAPIRELSRGATPSDPTFSWAIADPKLREWAVANREALELFLQGAEQPDAAHPAGEPMANTDLGRLIWVALIEGSRRQEGGDSAGAWACYRASLRMLTHVGRRGSLDQRNSAPWMIRWLERRLATWAADPRTTVPQLRAALEEALEDEPKSDWDSYAVKFGYLELIRAMERPMARSIQEEMEGEWTVRLDDMALSPTMVGSIEAARRFVWREPERSRRVLRLLCANFLAHVEAREHPPRKPAVRASFSVLMSTNPIVKGKVLVSLYPVAPGAPAGARALAPQEVASWLVATHDARLRLIWSQRFGRAWPPDRLVYRRAHRDLGIMLATEIYRRERGAPPPSEDALVGTSLLRLPDDDSVELDDVSAPIIE
jgi:hypothetical protein